MGCAESVPEEVADEVCIVPETVDGKAASRSDFHQAYILGKKLGQGSFGSVYAARPAAGHGRERASVAVKVIDQCARDGKGQRTQSYSRKVQRSTAREIEILRVLPRSANIIQFHGLHFGNDLVYMVLEKGSLRLQQVMERMHVLTEVTLKPIFKDMAHAVAVCHRAGISHRDIKPDNFLGSADYGESGFIIKLCDFGLASRISGSDAEELSGVFGTPPFMAPELLGGDFYSAKVDVWALGVIAYIFLFGTWPYMPKHLSGSEMKAAILSNSGGPQFSSAHGCPAASAAGARWVRALLQRDPGDRLSATEALQHADLSRPWNSEDLTLTFKSARLRGAFEAAGGRQQREQNDTDGNVLDKLLVRLDAESRAAQAPLAASEASTDAGSEVR